LIDARKDTIKLLNDLKLQLKSSFSNLLKRLYFTFIIYNLLNILHRLNVKFRLRAKFVLNLAKTFMDKTEYFPIVTENGEVTGKATRKECHSGSFLLHPVVHLHVFNSAGELYLQKRNMNKDIQPGKWDTSVGGHVDFGEETLEALLREVQEELGIVDFEPQFITRYKFTSMQEAEFVNVFKTTYNGDIKPNPDEISEGKFWSIEDIRNQIGKNIFTPNFEKEFLNIVEKIIAD